MTWRLNPASDLHWRCWDNEWVLFDQGSGQTHLINPISAGTLMQFGAQSLSFQQLLDKVATDMSLTTGPELASAVSQAVEQLVGLGLLESAPA
ncbi:HPr-rel-A system PqqD family peptide chaperone [Rhodoferax sp.]|uniref:HPr-rel-A system PqqD family peptide chaperone n=1 Tax=Rhodoferax sp. TaxID=50421 RepID=UPI0027552215|nr:HPr-rel-A system PqqD family peptide chaperone [Rhodoferax sp.]